VAKKSFGYDLVATEIDECHALRSSEKGNKRGKAVAQFLCRRRADKCQKLVWSTKDAPSVCEPPERKDHRVGCTEKTLRRIRSAGTASRERDQQRHRHSASGPTCPHCHPLANDGPSAPASPAPA